MKFQLVGIKHQNRVGRVYSAPGGRNVSVPPEPMLGFEGEDFAEVR
ncbi:MAG: hypothetical protein N3G20_03845 [Verrucomicrobiae bacterium]|nr:hypothetical protein [Verrucomicrobiae bacterium]